MADTQVIGVIFDMDGVLVDSADAHFESWMLLAAERGVSVTREQFDATFGRQNRDIIPIVFGESRDREVAAMSDRKEELYRDLVRTRPPVVDGSVQLVRGLHDAGAMLAVGSSAPRANIDLILDCMGVSALISAVVSADDVTRGKPDPQVFAVCCERLGLPPARCVVVEDAPAGTQAGRAAGAKTVAVLIHHREAAFVGVDLAVPRLADLTVEDLVALADAPPKCR